MIVAIGNAPSSGSTFLADILDSLPFAVCGPEINLFSVKPLFRQFLKQEVKTITGASALIYQSRQRLLTERLCAYGIEPLLLDIIIEQSKSFPDFCEEIFSAFASIRGKNCTFFFEKTPQNIHCADAFLETFSDGYFLHIIRNPLYVYKSLKNRGFPNYLAMHTWLADVSKAYAMRNHPRFITIKYEELVQSPYERVISLLNKMGGDYNSRELEQLYMNNSYRKTVSRKIKSWSINRYGEAGDANKKQIEPEDMEKLFVMRRTRLNKEYGALFGIESVAFNTLARYYGYDLDEFSGSYPINSRKCEIGYRSAARLFKKFLLDWRYGDASLRKLLIYLKPVEICAE